MFSFFRIGVLVLVTAVLSASAFGQAKAINDLVGMRGSSGESEMETRGYSHHSTFKDQSGSWSYWWNSSKKKCVMILTNDGRFERISDAEPEDCGQKSGMSMGTKIAIALAAAAAVGGTAAIVHKAHDHDNDKHSEDANYEAEYERGYRDGLYNTSYHNWNNSKDYSSGYSAGVTQRNNQTNYHSGWGGYQQYVSVNDLVGMRASSGENELSSRGFRNVEGFSSGNTKYTIWWRSQSRQCIQVATADGRYDSVLDIRTHPKCR